MKATELMIGDWILLGVEPIKVTYDLFLPGHLTDPYRPIPLTPEILEKNGFRNKPTYSVYHSEDEHIEITIYYNSEVEIILNEYLENEEIFTLPYVCYVHELQHTLRLCGLTELANNLKIE